MPQQKKHLIRLLKEETINKIAAGEVIEHAASVVKELVENALDAGATEIAVETQAAGRGLIRVSDNGWGMQRDDLFLALERHATSKIHAVEDLNSLGTLGFRGEALPSIAAISKMQIETVPEGGGEGTSLFVQGGKLLNWKQASRRVGTTLSVKALFFNVPVRKKFQKSLGWDRSEIHRVLTKAALCHPEVHFSWINEEREEFSLKRGETPLERIGALLGGGFAQELLPVEHEEGTCLLRGYVSKPHFHRPNRTGQYLFLNHRAIFSPFVSRQVLEAYGTRLPTHRFPLFVLHLTLPLEWVDVNVHPQKREVRLCEEAKIGAFLKKGVEKALLKTEPIYAFSQREEPLLAIAEKPAPYAFASPAPKEETVDWILPEKRWRYLQRVGRYLLMEGAQELLLIDGVAARARIFFETYSKEERKPEKQALLLPITIACTPAEGILFQEQVEAFDSLGIEMRLLGKNTLAIDTLPPYFEREDLEPLLAEWKGREALKREDMLLSLCRRIRCHALGAQEAEAMAERLFACTPAHECPLGRRTFVELSENEMEKWFKR